MLLRHKTIFLLAVIWILATVFNITKAVYIDDISTINIGNYLLKDPLHYYQAALNNVSDSGIPLEQSVTHPPLLFYLSSLIIFVFGRSELIFHAVWSIFTLISIVFFYLLAESFTGKGILLTFLFIAGPAFVPSQNLMLDTPLVSFFLTFFYFLLIHGEKLKGIISAGMAAGFTSLMKYSGLILIPIFALFLLLQRKYRHFWTIIIPIGMLILWSLYNLLDYGGIHLLSSTASGYALTIGEKWLLWIIVLGAVSPYTISLIDVLWCKKKDSWIIAATILFSSIITFKFLTFPGEKISLLIMRAIFFTNGLLLIITAMLIIYRILKDYFLKKNNGQYKLFLIAVWYVFCSVITVIYVPFMAVRYLLPVLPALLLLLGAKGFFSGSRTMTFLTVLLTLILSVNLAYSDWLQADVYRRGASQIREAIKQRSKESSFRVWSAGFYGWRFYTGQNGMRSFDSQLDELENGDFLAVTSLYPPNISVTHLNLLSFDSEITVPRAKLSFVSTMTNWPHNGAGYYYLPSLNQLPYILKPDFPMEKFALYRINK